MKKRLPLEHSGPLHPPGARKKGHLPPEERIRVTVVLRRSKAEEVASALGDKVKAILDHAPGHHAPLSRAELAKLHAGVDVHLPLIEKFARDHGLEVVRFSRATHDVVLEGPASALNRAFGVELEQYEHEGHRFHSHKGEIHLPEKLHSLIEDVLGLDDTPVARRGADNAAGTESATSTSFTPLELARYYRFPAGANGDGQRLAVLEFGGGFYESDLTAYWDFLGLETRPEVRVRDVDGTTNDPLAYDRMTEIMKAWNEGRTFAQMSEEFGSDFSLASYTLEVTGDAEIAGALASGGVVDVFFAPNTRQGWYDAIHAAVGLNDAAEEDLPAALSISWSVTEPGSGSFMKTVQGALENAYLLGVVVCCSAGDWGSRNTSSADAAEASVSFPASSPYSLACGGTQFAADDPSASRVEVVWNRENRGTQQATGGGVSGKWEIPDFQTGVPVPAHGELNGPTWISSSVPEEDRAAFRGCGVPDVAALADTQEGYDLLIAGERTVIGGTSLATPLWAGLLACLSQELGQRVGWIQTYIYRESFRDAFRSPTTGHNQLPNSEAIAYFGTGSGDWSCCCGLGVPDGEKLLECLRNALDAAGDA